MSACMSSKKTPLLNYVLKSFNNQKASESIFKAVTIDCPVSIFTINFRRQEQEKLNHNVDQCDIENGLNWVSTKSNKSYA